MEMKEEGDVSMYTHQRFVCNKIRRERESGHEIDDFCFQVVAALLHQVHLRGDGTKWEEREK